MNSLIPLTDNDYFFERLGIKIEPPKYIGEMSTLIDIRKNARTGENVYILCLHKDGCNIGGLDYVEYDYFHSLVDFEKQNDIYGKNEKLCYTRYKKYMDNFYKKLTETL